MKFILCITFVTAIQLSLSSADLNSKSENHEENENSAAGRQSAVYAMQGRPVYMEDRFIVEENINGSTGVSFFAIFDGHGGAIVADYAKEVMVPNMFKKIVEAKKIQNGFINLNEDNSNCNHSRTDNDIEAAKSFDAQCYVKNGSSIDYEMLITDEILAADKIIVEQAELKEIYSGSTALIALIEGSKLIVANVGDSRGVMCDSEGKTIPLSFDHKPDGESESKRIKEAGGFIAHYGVWRISGILATSRALGDYVLKPQPLIADPDILTFDLNEHKPQFLILASDGLFDTFTNEEAVAFIREHKSESDYGAKSITRESYRRGSYDNIATIVVVFRDGVYQIEQS